MNAQNRKDGYLPAVAFMRKERMVVADDGYYFKTREDSLIGPFPTESAANFEINIFLEIKKIEQEFLQQYKMAA